MLVQSFFVLFLAGIATALNKMEAYEATLLQRDFSGVMPSAPLLKQQNGQCLPNQALCLAGCMPQGAFCCRSGYCPAGWFCNLQYRCEPPTTSTSRVPVSTAASKKNKDDKSTGSGLRQTFSGSLTISALFVLAIVPALALI